MTQEYQIAQLLRIAKEQLAYCEYIESYPKKVGKRNFDTVQLLDQFYKNIHNVCFFDGLLIVGNLLNKDPRVMSFWNWPEFRAVKENKIQMFTDKYEGDGLKEVRDQIAAHIDTTNRNNNFPDSRRRGMINDILVQKLLTILNDLIAEFQDYTRQHSAPYSQQYFDITQATEEVATAMEQAKPQMTDNYII